MFAVEVRDHIMIAHSFRGDIFGPAQNMHGATFIVDACVMAETLDENGVVIDIGKALDVLKTTLTPLNYANLDEMSQFAGINTTTEYLCRYVQEALTKVARAGGLGRPADELSAIRVTIEESHVARAWYEAPI